VAKGEKKNMTRTSSRRQISLGNVCKLSVPGGEGFGEGKKWMKGRREKSPKKSGSIKRKTSVILMCAWWETRKREKRETGTD